MSKKTTLKKIFKHSVSAALLVASQGSFAHTTTLLEMTEGTAIDNAIAIGHGCELLGKPVVAQSVVFPTLNPIITSSGATPITDLNEVVEGGTLENIADLISSKDIFSLQGEKTNALTNTIGFYGKSGSLPTFALGRVPFQANAPKLGACVNKLTIEYAIADICDTTKPTIKPAKVNLWIPANGSQFAIKGANNMVDGVGDPAVMLIKRDPANPVSTDTQICPDGAVDVTVTISPEDINANLPIPGWTY